MLYNIFLVLLADMIGVKYLCKQKMVVKDLNTLVDTICSSDKESAIKLIEQYGNCRAESAVENTWKWVRKYVNRSLRHRDKKIKNHILDFNVDIGAIELKEFIIFFAAIEDELKKQMTESAETRKFAEDLHDFMWQKLGALKVDRRLSLGSD